MLIDTAAPAVVPAPSIIKISLVAGVVLTEPPPAGFVFQLAAVLHIPPVKPTQ